MDGVFKDILLIRFSFSLYHFIGVLYKTHMNGEEKFSTLFVRLIVACEVCIQYHGQVVHSFNF